MLCITEIKVVEANRDLIEIAHMRGIPFFSELLGSDPVERVAVEREVVHGREFVNSRGERVCIGLSRQVQELIGLPFEVFDDLSNELRDERIANIELHSRVVDYEYAGFWTRLRYAFTKKAPTAVRRQGLVDRERK